MIILGKNQLLWFYLNEDNIIGKWFSQTVRQEKKKKKIETETPMRHLWWDLTTEVFLKKNCEKGGWGTQGGGAGGQNRSKHNTLRDKSEQKGGDTLHLQTILSDVLK